MKISDAFPSKYFRGQDFTKPRILTIESVYMEKFPNGARPVIRFRGEQRHLVLNQTNTALLEQAFGDETEDWHGLEVEIHAVDTVYDGKECQGARVRPIPREKQVQQPLSNQKKPLKSPSESKPTPKDKNGGNDSLVPTDAAHLRAPRISYDE